MAISVHELSSSCWQLTDVESFLWAHAPRELQRVRHQNNSDEITEGYFWNDECTKTQRNLVRTNHNGKVLLMKSSGLQIAAALTSCFVEFPPGALLPNSYKSPMKFGECWFKGIGILSSIVSGYLVMNRLGHSWNWPGWATNFNPIYPTWRQIW